MSANRVAAVAAAIASVGAALIPLLADISTEATVVLCVVVIAIGAVTWKYLHGSQQWDALIGAKKDSVQFNREIEREVAAEHERELAEGEESLRERKAAMIQAPAGPHRQPGPKPKRR